MKGKISLLLLLMRFILYIMDIISDIYVAVQYYKNGETWWCSITLIFVIVPHFIINTYTAHTNVGLFFLTPFQAFLLWIFQISILVSFKQEFNRWKEERKEDKVGNINKTTTNMSLKMIHTFICLAEAFAESAPQWCLQNYIMIRQWHFPWYTVISTFLSLLSLAWSITSFENLQKTRKWVIDNNSLFVESFPKMSLVVFLVAHLSLLISRLTSLVIFAYVFRYYVFVIAGLHWLLVFIAICASRIFFHLSSMSMFANEGVLNIRLKRINDVLKVSLLAYSVMFYLSSGISKMIFRRKMPKRFRVVVFVFYAILLLENGVMVLLAIYGEAVHITILTKIILPLVFAGFFFGVLLLVLYYRCCHPSMIKTRDVRSNNTETIVLKESQTKEDDFEMNRVK